MYHIYVKGDGFADIVKYKLNLELFPGYTYLGGVDEKPDISGKKYVDGQWVRGSSEPEYAEQRRRAYPPPRELMKALWHAMDAGILPKVEGFYDKIAEVNKRFPEK